VNVLGRRHCRGRPVLSAKPCLPNYEFLQPEEGVISLISSFEWLRGWGVAVTPSVSGHN